MNFEQGFQNCKFQFFGWIFAIFSQKFFQKSQVPRNVLVDFDTPRGTDFQTEKPDRQILKFRHDFDWILKQILYFLTT